MYVYILFHSSYFFQLWFWNHVTLTGLFNWDHMPGHRKNATRDKVTDKKWMVAQTAKRLPTMREIRFQSLDLEDPLEEEMATHSSILAWKIPWTVEPGRLQSTGSQRVGHDWATSLSHQSVSSSRCSAKWLDFEETVLAAVKLDNRIKDDNSSW